MANGSQIMPLNPFQSKLGRLLAGNRSENNYLAGGAAFLMEPNTKRFSQDLDYFQDSLPRVAEAYESDRRTLLEHGCTVEPIILRPGYVRAIVRRGNETTKIEWARDSAWRFMPVVRDEAFGYRLHPIDLATNKVLALAGRDEPRDLLDTLYFHEHVLGLGPLVWGAVGKDPGFSPLSLLELLRRFGKVRPEDLQRLHLSQPIDLQNLKASWLKALQEAEAFIRSRPPEEAGCLYYSLEKKTFIDPEHEDAGTVVPHYGRPGGVLPQMIENDP